MKRTQRGTGMGTGTGIGDGLGLANGLGTMVGLGLGSGSKSVLKVVSKRVKSAILIQSVIRMHIAKLNVYALRYYTRIIGYRILAFVGMLRYRRMRPKIRAATKINKIIRGIRGRALFYRRVEAGIMITTSYRHYQARTAIREKLHRVERPLTLSIHGLRDIPKRLVYTEDIRSYCHHYQHMLHMYHKGMLRWH